MSLANFRTYQLALAFSRASAKIRCRVDLKDQLNSASSSIVLNLAEGSGKPSPKDRAKFYTIALGSFRESEAILDLIESDESLTLLQASHALGSHLFELHRSLTNPRTQKPSCPSPGPSALALGPMAPGLGRDS